MNLKNAFPDKSEKEIKAISKQFFKDLADLALETIKILKISPEELQKRIYFADSEALRKYFSQNESTIMLTAHFGNWEWAGQLFGLQTKMRPVQVVYLAIKSTYFNSVMKKIRTRFGNSVVKMEYSFKQVLQRQKEGIVTCFLADQTPQRHQAGLWTMFMNQMTPFFTGPEKIATRLGLNVYFASIYKEKRGYYRIDFTLITDKPKEEPENYIMEQYARLLENSIRKQPSTWLWSHRRWKHKFDSHQASGVSQQ
jgi:KDO2-lipid IV(A) lauroyltransferase